MPTPRRALAVVAAIAVAWPAAFGCASVDDVPASVPGCGGGEPIAGRPLRIVTTVAPITSIVANVVGATGAEVVGVVPEGRNSHTYEPAPSVAVALERADVVFMNGLLLEEPVRELALATLGERAELCELGTSILPEVDYLFDESFPEAGGAPNPHLWTNPPMAGDYAALVRDVLVARDPAHADEYRANHAALAGRIDALDAAVRTATATIPPERRLLLTYHDAYAYFAKEYQWTIVGAVQPSSFDEPTPRDVAALVDQVVRLRVPAVFGSEVFPSPVLRQIAAESGAEYVDDLRDDDLPGEPGDPEHSWLALMRSNFVAIVEALGGDASPLRDLDVSDVAPDTATYPQ